MWSTRSAVLYYIYVLYIYIYYIYIYIYIYIYVCVCVYVCMCVCVYVCMCFILFKCYDKEEEDYVVKSFVVLNKSLFHGYIYIYIYVCVSARVRVCICACEPSWISVYVLARKELDVDERQFNLGRAVSNGPLWITH